MNLAKIKSNFNEECALQTEDVEFERHEHAKPWPSTCKHAGLRGNDCFSKTLSHHFTISSKE